VSNGRMIMNWNDVIDIPPERFPGMTEENHENHRSGFEPSICRV
jgi:hypothetical protein